MSDTAEKLITISEESLGEILVESVKEVFGTMIFLSAEAGSDWEAPECEDGWLCGSIWFKGLVAGGLSISCSSQCAKAIAMSMVMADSEDEVDNDQVIDSLGELVNLVMGVVKGRLVEKADEIVVSIPSVKQGGLSQIGTADCGVSTGAVIDVDEKYPSMVEMWYKSA